MKASRRLLSYCLSLLLVQQVIQPVNRVYAEGAETNVSSAHKMDIATSYLKNAPLVTLSSNVSGTSEGYLSRLVNDSLSLPGVDRAQDLFYTVPRADVDAGSYIELDISYSDLLLTTNSTLTLAVDDKPLKSIFLTKDTSAQTKIKIPLGTEEVIPGFHKFSIIKHSTVSNDYCSDDVNPANWVKINRSSAVFINTKSTWTTSDVLKEYPSPFVEQGTQEEMYGAVLLPDNPSSELISSALDVAAYFSSRTATHKPTPILTESEWLSKDHLIPVLAVGGLNDWIGPVKKMIADNNIQVQPGQLSLDAFTATDLTKNDSRQVLLVSAENAKIIRDSIHLLTDQQFVDQLSGNQLTIKQPPQKQVKREAPKQLTFESFGFGNITLDEITRESQRLTFNIPSYWKLTNDDSLKLKIRVSPLLLNDMKGQKDGNSQSDTSLSENALTVLINDIPKTISFAELDRAKKENDSYIVNIPISEYMKNDQTNALNLTFAANIRETHNACVRDQNSGKWIFIDKESSVQMPHEILNETSFKYWPAPFVGDNGLDRTLFVLPKEVNGTILTQLSTLAQDMISQTQANSGFEVTRENEPEFEKNLKNHHLIIIGNPNQYAFMAKEQDKLLVKPGLEQVNLSNYNIINETTEYAAWIQPSIWDANSVMAVFQTGQGNAKSNEGFVHANVLQYLDKEQKSSQIVVMSKSKEVISLDLNNEHNENQTVPTNASAPSKTGMIWMAVIIGLLFLVGLFVLVRIWRRPK